MIMPTTINKKPEHRRIRREKNTIDVMIRLYCTDHHGTIDELCPDCSELRDYAHMRLDRCRYQQMKPTCGNCPIHCYKPSMKETVMDVMSYSGPRMTLRHPYLALMHLFDNFRKPPEKPLRPTKQNSS
ncbi:hypothetical protein LCGC14_1879630 [marine sediment metagenome]|uniref:Nitrous oxide-stimulated promoter n=1 Tax=marine sediment metagenome TaxID=412755 RepID=A0A0F9GQT3_9ZZZZ